MPATMARPEQIEKLRGQLREAMTRIEKRGQYSNRLSATVLVERGDNQLGLILIGAGGVEDVSGLLINPLEIYWPELLMRDRGGEGRFLGMEVLPLWLGPNAIYTPEAIEKIRSFLGIDGRIVYSAGYDWGLADALSPEHQVAKREIETWFGQDLESLVLEMKLMTNDDYVEAWRLEGPVRTGEGGFSDSHLRSFVNFAFDYEDYWSDDLKQLYDFVRSGLVGRSGHPRDGEVFRLATNDDIDGNRPFEMALWAKADLDKMRYHELSREIIGGFGLNLLTMLAPEGIRKSMMSNTLKGRDEVIAESILWYEAIRKLILEYQKSKPQG